MLPRLFKKRLKSTSLWSLSVILARLFPWMIMEMSSRFISRGLWVAITLSINSFRYCCLVVHSKGTSTVKTVPWMDFKKRSIMFLLN